MTLGLNLTTNGSKIALLDAMRARMNALIHRDSTVFRPNLMLRKRTAVPEGFGYASEVSKSPQEVEWGARLNVDQIGKLGLLFQWVRCLARRFDSGKRIGCVCISCHRSLYPYSPLVEQMETNLGRSLSVAVELIDSGVGGPGDLMLVFEFMKALDPTSVVRESEYESAAKSGNIFAGAYARFNGYLKEKGGFLPENVKKSFLVNTTIGFYKHTPYLKSDIFFNNAIYNSPLEKTSGETPFL